MLKRKSKDLNQTAFSVVQKSTGLSTPSAALGYYLQGGATPFSDIPPFKNPAAVALGRLGGLKGGKARAAKLTAKERKDIALKAAKARWKKNK